MSDRQSADVRSLTATLWDYHAGRIGYRQLMWDLGMICSTKQINRILAIGTYSYGGYGVSREAAKAELETLVKNAYLSPND